MSARLTSAGELFSCEIAASAIRDLGIAGGQQAIRARLDAHAQGQWRSASTKENRAAARARIALAAFDRLAELIGGIGGDATVGEHAKAIARLYREVSPERKPAPAALWLLKAIDDWTRTRGALGAGEKPIAWGAFINRVSRFGANRSRRCGPLPEHPMQCSSPRSAMRRDFGRTA